MEDDQIIRFQFARTSSPEYTVHHSRLEFVDGPLAALVRRQFASEFHSNIINLADIDPRTFRYIRRFLYGLPICLTNMTVVRVIDVAILVVKWSLENMMTPLSMYLCQQSLAEPSVLLRCADLLSKDHIPSSLHAHIRSELACYLSASLQSTFPNSPDADALHVIQTFHDINDLTPALSLAARQAPFLPLLHGVIAALEPRVDDALLGSYIRSLPVASAGVSRLLACDAATARWPARAVRIAVTAAVSAAHDVARASVPLSVGCIARVTISGVSLKLEAVLDKHGVRVLVNANHHGGEDSDGEKDSWNFFRIGIRSAEYPCEYGTVVNSDAGGDLVLENSNDERNNSGVVHFETKDVRKWMSKGDEDCEDILLSIEVELLRGNATVFAKRDELCSTYYTPPSDVHQVKGNQF